MTNPCSPDGGAPFRGRSGARRGTMTGAGRRGSEAAPAHQELGETEGRRRAHGVAEEEQRCPQRGR